MSVEINFARIRSYGSPASPANAFEELASILIRQRDDWPDGTQFSRFGNPDGGREGRGLLPGGDVWAWQAKYLFTFDASAAAQIKQSLIRTLDTEPNLARYFVALPIDLPAGDTSRSKSAFTRWTEQVKEWQRLAESKGLAVEFDFMGAHEMTMALTEPQNSGRVKYWFDTNVLTLSEQQQHIDDVTAKLGRRYSQKLHVNVDIEAANIIESVGRTPVYAEQWKRILAALRTARQWTWRAPEGNVSIYQNALAACNSALSIVDSALQRVIASVATFEELASAESEIVDGIQALQVIDDLMRTNSRTRDGLYVGDAAALYVNVRDSLSALRLASVLADSISTRAARSGEVLMTGRAGVGKTHLLCDAARQRIAAGRPTMMLLGQEFDRRSLLNQIPELGEMPGTTTDELLAVLDAAGEASGNKALLIIDALNESECLDSWPKDIRALRSKITRFPHLGLIVSCRTEFVDVVIGKNDIPSCEHFGFEEDTETAVRRFAGEYGLEIPTFPVLNPEFGNPLFLRLTCEALITLGAPRFVFGTAGLTTVCNAFIEAVNERLARSTRCDYDAKRNLVQIAIQKFADLGASTFSRDVVDCETRELLPYRTWSKSLMKGLLDEGILIEVRTDRIAFGYQRLGDVARAKKIVEKSLTDIKEIVKTFGYNHWTRRGTMAALAVMLPEIHGTELIDLVMSDGRVGKDIIDGFLESLTLREPKAIGSRTINIIECILTSRQYMYEGWNRLVRLACVPDHPLNAHWLHNYLSTQNLANRDATWSVWLIGALDLEEPSPIRTLIEWAWPSESSWQVVPARETATSARDEEPEMLAMLTIGWFLTTSDRTVRDCATKALVSLAEKHVSAFVVALRLLLKVNDPYVVERATAAACGVVLRNASVKDTKFIADALAEFVSKCWPSHLLTRDYIRRLFETARAVGWNGPDGFPPYGAEWPIQATDRDEIESLTAPPDYRYGTIWHSLTKMGDFGRYVLGPAIREIQMPDREATRDLVERAIFDRVRDLGWTPKKFEHIDGLIYQRCTGSLSNHVERIGKKYQWIALYEILGMLVDNFDIKSEWSREDFSTYSYPEQLIWRDIDVTLLARKPMESVNSTNKWFSPVTAQFPRTIVDGYPTDLEGVPDPLDLLAVTDPDGERWLALLSFPTWRQQHSVEIESLRSPRRSIWMRLHAYLVPRTSVDYLKSWAKNRDWDGRWMPDIAELANLLLGDHPNSHQWDEAAGPVKEWELCTDGIVEPVKLVQCGAWYAGTGTDRDASAVQETQGFVPSRTLFDLLSLEHGVDFVWKNDAGVSVLDPAVFNGGSNVLLLKRGHFQRIKKSGFALFWTVLVGHEHSALGHGAPGDDYRWISASASYVLIDDTLEKICAQAGQYAPGPYKEYDLEWHTKNSE